MITYKIANFYLGIDSFSKKTANWKQFLSIGDKPDFHIYCIDPITINRDIKFDKIDGCENIMFSGNSVMLVDKKYKNAYVYPYNEDTLETFAIYLFNTNAVQQQMLQFHCSIIEDKGRGILFLGPSGIGKTTQAERWAEYRGSTIINGDVGFVERTRNGYLAWGTPWHGSSSYCLNTSVPIKALVVLKQAPENQLRELNGFEKVSEVSSHIFYPTWFKNGIELCTETLNHLLNDLPVYRLDNRADEEAVKLLAKEIDRLG